MNAAFTRASLLKAEAKSNGRGWRADQIRLIQVDQVDLRMGKGRGNVGIIEDRNMEYVSMARIIIMLIKAGRSVVQQLRSSTMVR